MVRATTSVLIKTYTSVILSQLTNTRPSTGPRQREPGFAVGIAPGPGHGASSSMNAEVSNRGTAKLGQLKGACSKTLPCRPSSPGRKSLQDFEPNPVFETIDI